MRPTISPPFLLGSPAEWKKLTAEGQAILEKLTSPDTPPQLMLEAREVFAHMTKLQNDRGNKSLAPHATGKTVRTQLNTVLQKHAAKMG